MIPLLLILFAASGAAALIYEVVWLQLLQLVIGSSAVSLAVLLGTYMGGMCAGSLLFSRLIPENKRALRVYALLELATAAFGLAVLFGLPAIERLYVAGASHGLPGMLLRGLACAVCLLPPTLLMGATLPAIAREVPAASWGYFYGANIGGGVLGCLVAGFYLLRVHDMTFATYVAVVLNLLVGAAAWICSQGKPPHTTPEAAGWAAAPAAIFLSIGISGFCALGAEVVWTRILSLMLGPTVYTFSIILGVFLAALGIGSAIGSRLARDAARARLLFAVCQLLLCLTILCAAFAIYRWLPYWAGNVNSTAGPWKNFQGDILRAFIAVFPSALFWGASFPLALAAAASGGDPARTVGSIYGANTIGAIAGSILFSLWIIPSFGTQGAQRILIALAALGGALLLRRGFLPLAGSLVAAALIALYVPPLPWMLIGFGRRLPVTQGTWNLLSVTEGRNSSVAYSKYENVTTYFHVSGKVEASAEPQDMSLQRMLGHLPALMHSNPQSVLIVGFGAGVTAGTFVTHPEVKRIRICEIEPAIPPSSDRFFGKENHHVLRDPRTSVTYDDARHFVLTSPEKYDIITSDPIHPWVKGMASLYTTEYFEMCKRHLNPGGFVTQWVPLYESSPEAVRSEIATFVEAFPNATVWGNVNIDGTGYDLVLMGQAQPLRIDVDEIQNRIDQPDHAAVRESLSEAGYKSFVNLLATYSASAADLRGWTQGAEINRDRNLRLQYLAGLGVNRNDSDLIFSQILGAAKFPADILNGSDAAMLYLRQHFDQRQ